MIESVPSQSVDYCITVLSGWIDDVIALSSPKTLFSASKGAGIVAFPGVLRFWQSCGYGCTSTWHDFCIIWGVHNCDIWWVIRGCRAKKTDSKTGHGA